MSDNICTDLCQTCGFVPMSARQSVHGMPVGESPWGHLEISCGSGSSPSSSSRHAVLLHSLLLFRRTLIHRALCRSTWRVGRGTRDFPAAIPQSGEPKTRTKAAVTSRYISLLPEAPNALSLHLRAGAGPTMAYMKSLIRAQNPLSRKSGSSLCNVERRIDSAGICWYLKEYFPFFSTAEEKLAVTLGHGEGMSSRTLSRTDDSGRRRGVGARRRGCGAQNRKANL